MRLARLVLPALLLLLAAAPALAAPKRPVPARPAAEQAVERAAALKAGHGVRTGREVSVALHQLAAALPALSGADRLAAERLLARPTDDPDPQDDTYRATSVVDTQDTAHFRIHFVKAPNGDPDITEQAHVDELAAILEEAYSAEVGALGWRPPPSDGTLGGDGRIDVYLKNVLERRIFGYVAIDPGQDSTSSVPHWSYMVLDNGYTEAGSGRESIIKATVAHELNHVLQNGYDYLQDVWMFESTAVWMEEEVYGGVDDYLRYLGDWSALPHVPLAAFRLDPETGEPDAESIKAYGSAVWNHWLDSRIGRDAIRDAWERSPGTGDFAPAAYDGAIAARADSGFAQEFERFAAQTAEWRAPGMGFPDLYPDVARAATLPADGTAFDLSMDHTTFQHFDIPVAALSTPVIQATATFPSGTAGAIALVGRAGGDTDGAVTTALERAPAGGVVRVRLDDPARFARITAVAINSDATTLGFDRSVNDWLFREAQPVRIAADSARGPSACCLTATEVRDKSATLNAALAANVLDTAWRFEYGPTVRYGSTVAATGPLRNGNVAERVSLPVTKLRPSTVYHFRVVAENALGRFESEDRTFLTAADRTPPLFSVSAPARARRSRGLPARLRCDEACTVTATITIGRRAARRLRVGRTLARARTSVAEGVAKRVRVRIPRRARAKLARARTLNAVVTWRATDEFGNSRKLTRKLRLAR